MKIKVTGSLYSEVERHDLFGVYETPSKLLLLESEGDIYIDNRLIVTKARDTGWLNPKDSSIDYDYVTIEFVE